MSSRPLNILHLASFSGNIGDIANHSGFYQKFREEISSSLKIDQLEIRKFYRNRLEMEFNNEFAELANRYDLIILGGGGFFDLNWDYSNTGTTINFSEELIQKIKKPVLVNSMGYHEFGEVKEANVEKFKRFIHQVICKDNWFVSVRNDGSHNRINNRYGELKGVITVPDHGFFFRPRQYNQLALKREERNWIGMNINNDLFSKDFNLNVDPDTFNELISQFINRILERDPSLAIILFPHTPQDLLTIGILMGKIKEKYVRERLIVAPYICNGQKAVEAVFDLKQICSMIIGMRFHTNVCSVGANIPTIGLAGHEQISSLYEELGMPDRCIKINNKRFGDELLEKFDESLRDLSNIKDQYTLINKKLNVQADLYYQKLREWILK